MPKVRAGSFFYVINGLGQNGSKFRILPDSEIVVILGNLSKMAVFEQLNDQLLVDSK